MSGTGKVSISSSAVGNIQTTHQYNVTVTFQVAFDYGGYNNYGTAYYNISCDGQSTGNVGTNFNIASGGGSWVWGTIATRTFTVTMPTSGQAKTIGVSATLTTGVNPATISASGSHTLGAVTWQYTVSYNANGGSGAPSAQTKNHGTNLTLSSTKPTKSGYVFLGWATTNNATTPTYSAGGTYSANANVTLYAVWKIGTLQSFTFSSKSISIASTTGGVANPVAITVPYEPVRDNNIYTTPFYYKVCYVDNDSGDVANINNNYSGTIYGPYTQKDISDGGGGTYAFNIPITASLVTKSIQNCANATSVKFLVAICTGDNSFSTDLVTRQLLTVNLTNFNILYGNVVACYRSGNNTYIKLQVKFPASYTASHLTANIPKISVDNGSFTQLTSSQASVSVGSGNLVTYSITLSSTIISTGSSHSLILSLTDNLFNALIYTRVGAVGGENIYLCKSNQIKAIEFIETDTGVMFQKGGKFYAGEFKETDSGIMIGNTVLCGELVEI